METISEVLQNILNGQIRPVINSLEYDKALCILFTSKEHIIYANGSSNSFHMTDSDFNTILHFNPYVSKNDHFILTDFAEFLVDMEQDEFFNLILVQNTTLQYSDLKLLRPSLDKLVSYYD